MGSSIVHTIHHIEFHVSNALQSAFWYCCNFGFKRFAFRRSEYTSEIAVKNGSVILLFKCALKPNCAQISQDELSCHGDYVKDVAFEVDDIFGLIKRIEGLDASVVVSLPTVSQDSYGSVTIAKVRGSAGSMVHTLVQKSVDYSGIFLPGFKAVDDFTLNSSLIPTSFAGIDHVVEGHAEGTTDDVMAWYSRILEFRRFWSIDDKSVFTEYSALRASILSNSIEKPTVQIVLVEPVRLNRDFKGQVQEFLDHHGAQGVQHVAFTVTDICVTVAQLRDRGVEFLHIPDSYYDELERRIAESSITVVEDMKKIRELKLLLDFDEGGYLLQIFTKPMQDRPTFFVEIIQRHNFNGFGAGNFKALFSAVELEQKKRNKSLTYAKNGA